MIKVAFSSSFRRAFKKRIIGNEVKEKHFYDKLKIFTSNPFHPTLRTHKLTGKLQTLWSFYLSQDLRVVFYFLDNHNVIFENIGSHDEVY